MWDALYTKLPFYLRTKRGSYKVTKGNKQIFSSTVQEVYKLLS